MTAKNKGGYPYRYPSTWPPEWVVWITRPIVLPFIMGVYVAAETISRAVGIKRSLVSRVQSWLWKDEPEPAWKDYEEERFSATAQGAPKSPSGPPKYP